MGSKSTSDPIDFHCMGNMDNWTLNGQFPLSFVLHRNHQGHTELEQHKGADDDRIIIIFLVNYPFNVIVNYYHVFSFNIFFKFSFLCVISVLKEIFSCIVMLCRSVTCLSSPK